MSLFKRGQSASPAAPRMMKVFRQHRGPRTTVFVSPGVDFPEVDEYFLIVPKSRLAAGGEGGTERMVKSMSVEFIDGEATVDERTGKHLISMGVAFKKPQRVAAVEAAS